MRINRLQAYLYVLSVDCLFVPENPAGLAYVAKQICVSSKVSPVVVTAPQFTEHHTGQLCVQS